MAEKEHSKIINRTAKQILQPNGLERKGRSQTWYDDHGWFTTIVEFQPHKWKHGAFLNVGVNFHWYTKGFLSFDIGHRESGFEKFENSEQFSAQIEPMVQLALRKVIEYRSKMADLKTASETILNYHFTSDSLWGNYHRGVICALNDDTGKADSYFKSLLEVDHDVPWADELKSKTQKLMHLLDNREALRQHLSDIVMQTRTLKKLKEIDFSFG